ncbi:unnamed protein product, partial [Onchocerca ochengi]
MILNGEEKSVNLNTDDENYHIRFDNELFFCAGDIEVGLSGCLRGIYVDYFDVIDGYTKGSAKVNTNAELRSCDGNGLSTMKTPETEILPLLDIGKKLLNEITDEQMNENDTGSEYKLESDHEPEH